MHTVLLNIEMAASVKLLGDDAFHEIVFLTAVWRFPCPESFMPPIFVGPTLYHHIQRLILKIN